MDFHSSIAQGENCVPILHHQTKQPIPQKHSTVIIKPMSPCYVTIHSKTKQYFQEEYWTFCTFGMKPWERVFLCFNLKLTSDQTHRGLVHFLWKCGQWNHFFFSWEDGTKKKGRRNRGGVQRIVVEKSRQEEEQHTLKSDGTPEKPINVNHKQPAMLNKDEM